MKLLLQDLVRDALTALRIPHRYEGDTLLAVSIPEEAAFAFGGRREIVLCFDPAVRGQASEVDLVVPGCSFLDGLGTLLEQGGAVARAVAGLAVRPHEVNRQVAGRLTVLAGRAGPPVTEVRHREVCRYTVLVAVGGSERATEVLPIFCDLETGEEIPGGPIMAASLYDAAEARRLLSASEAAPRPPEAYTRHLDRVHRLALARIRPWLAERLAANRRAMQAEEQAVERYYEELLGECEEKEEQAAIREEWSRKRKALAARFDIDVDLALGGILHISVPELRTTLRVEAVRHGGEPRPIACEVASTDLRGGLPLCACGARTFRVVASARHGTLLCEACGAVCRVCGEGVRREDLGCAVCERDGVPAWREGGAARCCRDCLIPCACCGEARCPDHLVEVPCCGRKVCTGCTERCDACRRTLCKDHVGACATCGRPCCQEHLHVFLCHPAPVPREPGPAGYCARCAPECPHCQGAERICPVCRPSCGGCTATFGPQCAARLACAVTGKPACPDHGVLCFTCGRWTGVWAVGRCALCVPADPICHACSPPEGPPGALLAACRCGRRVCGHHRARCICHGETGCRDHLERDAYDGDLWCRTRLFRCPRCGQRAPFRPGAGADRCLRCAEPLRSLDEAPDDVRALWLIARRRFRPPWAWLFPVREVRVAAGRRRVVFHVRRFLLGTSVMGVVRRGSRHE